MKDQVKNIAARVKSGNAVTHEEFSFLILNDKEAFLSFMIKNNPGSMNHVLRDILGYTHELGFKPDEAKIGRICDIILQRNNAAEIKTILDNFQFNLDKISPKLLTAIKAAQK